MGTRIRMRIYAWSIALLVSLIALGRPAYAAAAVGHTAPPLVVQELDRQVFDLSALRGKVVIVNFWATWCPPCRQEMPVLDRFYRQYHGEGLEMIGLSVDRSRERNDVRTLMQSFSYPAAMLHDATVNGLGAPTLLPVTLIIDGAGVVRARLSPNEAAITEKGLSDTVLPLLSQEPAAP